MMLMTTAGSAVKCPPANPIGTSRPTIQCGGGLCFLLTAGCATNLSTGSYPAVLAATTGGFRHSCYPSARRVPSFSFSTSKSFFPSGQPGIEPGTALTMETSIRRRFRRRRFGRPACVTTALPVVALVEQVPFVVGDFFFLVAVVVVIPVRETAHDFLSHGPFTF